MSIGIGVLCQGGAIIAADTNIAHSDDSRSQGRKVFAVDDLDGNAYVVANAANDGDAANTLVQAILSRLAASRVGTEPNLRQLLANLMTIWSLAYGTREPPFIELLFAAPIAGDIGLYLCKPPNTILRSTEAYQAVGIGARVTDPLYKLLFTSCKIVPPRFALRFVCYMLYRAKKEETYLAGSRTLAFYLDARKRERCRGGP